MPAPPGFVASGPNDPVPAGRIRVQGPNGEFGTIPSSGSAPAASTAAGPPATQPNYNRTILPDLARAGTNALPGVGAMAGLGIGSMLGGVPGGMLGTAIGSKAGEWARYGLAPGVGLNEQVPPMLGMNDAVNAGLAGLGMGSAALGEAAAPGMMRTGLKMPPTWREQWLAKVAGGETPEQAALRMGVSGVEKASRLKISTGRAQGQAILQAEQAGHRITAEDLAQSALDLAAEKGGASFGPTDRTRIIRQVAKQADELLNQAAVDVKVRNLRGPRPASSSVTVVRSGVPTGTVAVTGPRPKLAPETVSFTPTQVATIKQAAQKIASPKFNQSVQGVNVKATPDEAQLLAEGARASLANLPKVAARTLENQKARLLTRTLSRAGARQQTSLPQMAAGGVGMSIGGALGAGAHGPIGAAIGAPLIAAVAHQAASPEMQREFALALMNPLVQHLITYGPMAASIPVRMMMTPGPFQPDTLPPNPAWGGSAP